MANSRYHLQQLRAARRKLELATDQHIADMLAGFKAEHPTEPVPEGTGPETTGRPHRSERQ